MRGALSAWLAGREPRPPDGLAASISREAAAADPPRGESLASALADLAFGRLDGVASSSRHDRVAAHDLLLADALITYALEAQAAHGPEVLRGFARELARRGGAGG